MKKILLTILLLSTASPLFSIFKVEKKIRSDSDGELIPKFECIKHGKEIKDSHCISCCFMRYEGTPKKGKYATFYVFNIPHDEGTIFEYALYKFEVNNNIINVYKSQNWAGRVQLNIKTPKVKHLTKKIPGKTVLFDGTPIAKFKKKSLGGLITKKNPYWEILNGIPPKEKSIIKRIIKAFTTAHKVDKKEWEKRGHPPKETQHNLVTICK